jgi:hypothetical protein
MSLALDKKGVKTSFSTIVNVVTIQHNKNQTVTDILLPTSIKKSVTKVLAVSKKRVKNILV